MKKKLLIPFAITLFAALAVTASAQGRMTEAQLLEYAASLSPCSEGLAVLGASYVSETSIEITCGPPTGLLPGEAAGLGGAGVAAGAGIVLAAIAAGGSSGTTSTSGTQ